MIQLVEVRAFRSALFMLLPAALLAACQDSATSPATEGRNFALGHHVVLSASSLHLPWQRQGEGLGLRPGGEEERAWGPQAATLDGAGRLWVLDNERERIVRVAEDGRIVEEREAPRFGLDLAFAPDGTYAVLRGGAHELVVYGKEGAESHPLPAALVTVRGIAWAEGDWWGITAYGESVPLLLARPLASRRTGLPGVGGTQEQLRLEVREEGSRQVEVYRPVAPLLDGGPRREELVVAWPTTCDAVQHLGLVSSGARALLCDERTTVADGRMAVARRLELRSPAGELVAQEPLPVPTLYVPFRAVRRAGDDFLVLVPEADGLSVRQLTVTREEGEQ